MNWKLMLGIGVVTAGAFGIYTFYKRQVNLLKQFTTQLSGIKFNSITTQLIDADIKIRITNISKLEATVTNIYGEVYMGDTNPVKVAVFNESSAFVLPAQGQNDIPIHVSFSPQQVLANLIQFILTGASKGDMKINIKGYVSVKSGFLTANVPYDYDTSIKQYLS